MVVASFLGNVADKLGDLRIYEQDLAIHSPYGTCLNFAFQLTLEATPDDLPLARLQTVRH